MVKRTRGWRMAWSSELFWLERRGFGVAAAMMLIKKEL
jgi:hypothetical protein